jgi:hypothetical protein
LTTVLDASGKPADGLLMGNLVFLGSYSSCLDVKVEPHQHNQSEVGGFR